MCQRYAAISTPAKHDEEPSVLGPVESIELFIGGEHQLLVAGCEILAPQPKLASLIRRINEFPAVGRPQRAITAVVSNSRGYAVGQFPDTNVLRRRITAGWTFKGNTCPVSGQ